MHYETEINDFVKEKLADSFIFVNTVDYNNLLGNNADNQIYIRSSDGTFIPKPPYIPTLEEEQQANLIALNKEYNDKISALNDEIVVAVTVDQDEEYAVEL